MFQSLSLTNELDLKINKCKEIEKSIIASYGEYHGVQNDIIEDCLNLPCWRKHGDDNIYIIGLSDDWHDNYWLCCAKRKTWTDKKITMPIEHFPDYYFYFITCLDDVFREYPDLGSSIKLWSEDDKKLLHQDTINFFKVMQTDPYCKDRLLYLAV